MNFDFNSQPTPKDYKHEYLLMFIGMLCTYVFAINTCIIKCSALYLFIDKFH